MRDIKDLCARIEEELSKIADSGLTTGNLEMTYKLIDMYKDIKNTQYWDKKVEYYNTVLDEMRGGYNDDYSERGRKRDSMGRYSATVLGALTGAIITERVYVVPGIGNLLTEAINKYDNGVIVGGTLFYAILTVTSLILGDVLMAMVDPRISFSTKDR